MVAGAGAGGLLLAATVGRTEPAVPEVPWLTCAVVGPEDTARITPRVIPKAIGTASGAAARAVACRLDRCLALCLPCPMPPTIRG
jgi:hypothetical protein